MTQTLRALHNLPAPVRPLVGRGPELTQLLELLRNPTCRLVTLTGPGGAGKTRLALDAALAVAPAEGVATAFSAGVFLVELAAVEPEAAMPEQLAALTADVLGLDLGGDRVSTERLAAAIRERPLLLLFDNCEHLPALPAFVMNLLADTPELTVLATSRSRLELRGEWVIDLQGLATPPEQARTGDDGARYDAVRLFVDSARTVAPDFEYTPGVAPAVARICRQVAGLPLGIELAASWTAVLSCGEIADEIAQNLDFLASELNDLPTRQQSLRAVFSSSWALLTAAEQQAARRLACFQGDFSREAAAVVAGAGLPLLGALVKKSLVRRVAVPNGAGTRYALIGHLRRYAGEQLAATGEAEATAARHGEHYLTWLARLSEQLRSQEQQAALAAIGFELAEVRAAWRWAVQARAGEALGAAAEALYLFCTMRSRFQEGADLLLTAAHALDDDAHRLAHGRLLARAGWCTFQLGRHREARGLLERSLALLREVGATAELPMSLNALASLNRHVGAYEEALALAGEGLALSTAAGDRYGMAITATTLSQTSYASGRLDEARRYAEQSVAVERELGNRWGSVFNLITLGQIARSQGAIHAARGHFQEALAIRTQLNDTRGMALCLNELGDTALATGEREVAGWCYEQSLSLFHTIGNLWGELATLRRLAQLAQLGGRHVAAARIYGEALRKAEELGAAQEATAVRTALDQLPPVEGASLDRPQPTLRQALAETLSPATAAPVAPQVVAAQPTTDPPPDLTAREVEVLRLVAVGLTDAQVAERLVLSTRTVSSYLTSVYSKLQVRSRSAATRWAIERGLA